MNESMNQLITKKFVEQPLALPGSAKKLDGVGPVDNRPSTNKLHQVVQKKIKNTCDM